MADEPIPALLPRGAGHQFLIYGDSCSGVPGALHEQTFAAVNAVVRRLAPAPEFILFPGDEVRDHDDQRWTSCSGASATGIERLAWPGRWSIGHGQAGLSDRPFAGPCLTVASRTR